MRYIRRIDNPLKVLASGFVSPGGLGEFDPAVYEEIEGQLPEGWVQEVRATPADQLKAIYESQDIEVQLAFYGLVPQILTALENNRADIAQLIIERAQIPVELEPIRQTMLDAFNA